MDGQRQAVGLERFFLNYILFSFFILNIKMDHLYIEKSSFDDTASSQVYILLSEPQQDNSHSSLL